MSKEKLNLIEWCDKQVELGNELAIAWDGGGDSGWAYFKLNGDEINNEYTEILLDHIYDELDYGSWAGEFTANGEAIYSKETKSFEGIDYYTEDSYIPYSCNLCIKVPKDFSFERIIINFEYSRPSVTIETEVEECSKIINMIEEDLKNQYNLLIEDISNSEIIFNGCSYEHDTNHDEYKVEGDFLVHIIDSVTINSEESSEKKIVLNLNEINF